MINIILNRAYFLLWIETTKLIYLFAKFRASLLRPIYSPKISIVGLWAFGGLSLVQILGTLGSGYMPK